MKVVALSHFALRKDFGLAFGMHSLRRRVFKDRLDWSVSISAGLEIDQYDLLAPTYLLVLEHREVIGCVRLLPTTGRNMLADTFSSLLQGKAAPSTPRIWESSRFCVDREKADATAEGGLKQATLLLFAAMIEWGRYHRLDAIATVTDLRMERILRRAGWGLARLGEPQQIGTTKAVAGLLPLTDSALAAVCAAGTISGPVYEDHTRLAVAA